MCSCVSFQNFHLALITQGLQTLVHVDLGMQNSCWPLRRLRNYGDRDINISEDVRKQVAGLRHKSVHRTDLTLSVCAANDERRTPGLPFTKQDDCSFIVTLLCSASFSSSCLVSHVLVPQVHTEALLCVGRYVGTRMEVKKALPRPHAASQGLGLPSSNWESPGQTGTGWPLYQRDRPLTITQTHTISLNSNKCNEVA